MYTTLKRRSKIARGGHNSHLPPLLPFSLAPFLRQPSLVAGLSVGGLYLLAAQRIKSGQDYGYELAALNSLALLGSSAPRFAKGPVPKGLTVLGAVALAYYGKKVYDFSV